ncbi:triphosphoribosyl-dephospho-CoA synthase CitG [Christensenellaceae bacterium OttesenSCG-928-L17]|nr:triphosphoribosyl-dephospho-CoA synthase CitG [Christensenellaceae bacterium OttesenSCG-928-L17]
MPKHSSTKIAQLCHDALIAEVELTPKPGLVDRNNNGAHRDMTRALFHKSADALLPYFRLVAEAGAKSAAQIQADAFLRMRPLGVEAERAMFLATGGVNTHKGAIFSMGLLAAACGRINANGEALTAPRILRTAAGYVRGLCAKELAAANTPHTKGEHAYAASGALGARGEAEAGFPSIQTIALPALSLALKNGHSKETALLVALLALLANVDDTNMISRASVSAARAVRTSALALNEKGPAIASPQWYAAIRALDDELIHKNLSPGGCADLLACTCFVYDVTH